MDRDKNISKEIDVLPIEEIVRIMNDENDYVTRAIDSAKNSISHAINDAVAAIKSGRSLIYIGAGTSGRLGVLDASEVRAGDMVLGISASGTTPYTIAALKEGKRRNAKCWLLTRLSLFEGVESEKFL